ncbi:MAG TPA: FG-GAP-like repeat-containing protein [Nocardioidaceae bacterium]|nr:FG-GAP-like repeat-containing protein [Nocardioidaceae bacterium]
MSHSRDRYVLLCQQALVFAVVGAVVAPAVGVVSLDIVSPNRDESSQIAAIGRQSTGALVATAPVVPTVTEVRLTPAAVDGRLARSLPGQTGGAEVDVVTQPQAVTSFATVGVTWQHGVEVDEDDIVVSVRTKRDGRWSRWEALEYHDDHQPDPDSPDALTSRPGTEAYVVGNADSVQVRAERAEGLPPDLKLALVDPGEAEVSRVERPAIDTARLTAFQSGEATDPAEPLPPETDDPSIVPAAGADVTPQPQIFSRAQWGADERMRDKSALRYGEVHAGFVHHTVNANGYTRAEVPSILRGIYAYHTQSRGWSDIGYNFLVDRFGRIWEGRYGGVGRPAVGAHTLNYNEYAFAMSAIGNFENVEPSAAMLDAYGRLFAWKLSLHGVSAASTRQWVGSRAFPAVNGHRDAASTACPGRYLYRKIPAIRELAAKYQRSFASRDLSTDISGTNWPDLVVRDRATNTMQVVRTGGQVRYLAGVRVGSGFGSKDLIVTPGDVTGDGYADVIARERATGVTSVYPGSSSGKLGASVKDTERFADLDQLVAVGDFNGDKRNDLVGRNGTSKKLLLFPGLGGGSFGESTVLAGDWSPNTITVGIGDFDRDSHPDLVARSSDGRLFLVPGRGSSLGTPRLIGSGFNAYNALSGRGDVTNDGYPDLVARVASTGEVRVFTGDGTGGLGTYNGPYGRFGKLTWIAGGGQWVGSSAGDLIGRNPRGALVAFPNSGGRNISKIVPTGVDLTGVNLLRNVGDWNHDGYGDVMTRTGDGHLHLLLGLGGDKFAPPKTIALNWAGIKQIVLVGDVTGDGHNDLMGRNATTGAFMIYPGNGSTGFLPSYQAHSKIGANRQIAVGLYDGDGAPDTMTTTKDGTLWFYPGNGPGGMTTGRKVAVGLQVYDWLIGLGDLDGDGNNDLLGRHRSNGSLSLIPGMSTGFGPARFVASGFGGYDLAG